MLVKGACRDVAQPGSARAWGARGRWFESSRPDEQEARSESCGFCFSGSLESLLSKGGRENKTVPTKSGRGFLGKKESNLDQRSAEMGKAALFDYPSKNNQSGTAVYVFT